ncbi:unnamed protein product [Mycena citricolor]|uniref:Uncharacterized protein n=1 Tax=Mycena citricolor TaxID=2018698 RepID=A0AAD2H7R3_9AGAR|nr:unnamed protein product [Mycena citricolor]
MADHRSDPPRQWSIMPSSRSTHAGSNLRSNARTPGRENAPHGSQKDTLRGSKTLMGPMNSLSGNVPLQERAISPVKRRAVPEKSGKSLINQVPRPLVDETPAGPIATNKSGETFYVKGIFDRTPIPDKRRLASLLTEANKTNGLFAREGDGQRTPAIRTPARRQLQLERGLGSPLLLDGRTGRTVVLEDEIEYMPPRCAEIYIPPFDFELPNYKAVGAALLVIASLYPLQSTDQKQTESHSFESFAADSQVWTGFPLSQLAEEEPFCTNASRSMVPVSGPVSKKIPSTRRTGARRTIPLALGRTKVEVPSRVRTKPNSQSDESDKHEFENLFPGVVLVDEFMFDV